MMTPSKTTMNRVKHRIFIGVHILIAISLISWIGYRTQMTANRQMAADQTALSFAEDTRECLHQLLNALAARNKINAEDQILLSQEHELITGMLVEMSHVETSSNDDEKVQWEKVKIEYVPKIRKLHEMREQLQRDRVLHPYPDPACPAVEEGEK